MFRILHPKMGQTVKLFRYKFAVSGRAPTGSHPLVGVLKGSKDDSLVVGRTLREPRKGRSTWTMVFDLKEIPGVSTDTFTLSIFRIVGESGNWQRLADPVTGITFSIMAIPVREANIPYIAVSLGFPAPNQSYCRFGIMAYGLLTDPDTRLDQAELQVEGTSTLQTADFQDSDNEGFWVATFDEMPDSASITYKLTAYGNSGSASASGLKFLESECS